MTGTDGAGDTAPSDAFQVLGNETRVNIVRSLAHRERATFTSLYEDSQEDTSAGFAYHLRQLDDLFVSADGDEYELTAAGREVARAVRTGKFTESTERPSTPLDERCPFCDEPRLEAIVDDGVTAVHCVACDSPVLDTSVPSSGYATHDERDFPDALDAYHRHRIRSFADDVCPDCGGSVTTTIDRVSDETHRTPNETVDSDKPVASFTCGNCGRGLRCPVALTVLDHPAIVSFYHDQGVDIADRPIWNVGPEWREHLVSTAPLCIRVTTRLEAETAEALHLYVADDLRVVDHRREPLPDDAGNAPADGAAS